MNPRARTLLADAAMADRSGNHGAARDTARALLHELEASTDPFDADLAALLRMLFSP